MSSVISKAVDRKLVSPPRWLPDNIIYEVLMGSVAYGVSSDTSDMDIYGIAIPPKDIIFPHLKGVIHGFDKQVQDFHVWQEHHINDESAKKEYDFSVYSIVSFFDLARENNPNIIDSLFVPANCVLYSNRIGNMIRENRRLFLHKGCWPKFKGYAYSQLSKIDKQPKGKRVELVDKYGYDVKFAYHVVRLIDEVEQILTTHDINLQRNNDQLKAIRRGEWTQDRLRQWFANKEADLERVYSESKLREFPDTSAIKSLLIACLEEHYGSLSAVIYKENRSDDKLRRIQAIIEEK